MKRYIYFVSYSCQNKRDCSWGFGCSEVMLDSPITSFDQLAKIVSMLQNESDLMKVTPLYYTLLREEKEK